MATEQGTVRGGERAQAAPEKPQSVLQVDRVTHQDVPAICALYKKVWDPAPSGIPVELVKTWTPTPLEFTSWMEGVTYFAARREGRLVGVVGLEFHHASGRLVHLAVDPEVRRQHVASSLVTAATEWAKRGNATSIWADSLQNMEPVTALFHHLHFAHAGTLHRHEWGQDVNFFELVFEPRTAA